MKRNWNAHQKAGQATLWLIQGNQLTTTEIARLTGMTFYGAKYMMEMMSLTLPITQENGKWCWLCESDTHGE